MKKIFQYESRAEPEVEQIGKRRRLLSWTQRDLAGKTGISQSLIAKIEAGKTKASYDKIKKILTTLDEAEGKTQGTAGDIMTPAREIIGMGEEDSVKKAAEKMRKHDLDQLPVYGADKKIVGSIRIQAIRDYVAEGKQDLAKKKVRDLIEEEFPQIPEDTPIQAVSQLLKYTQAVLVKKRGQIVGIISNADIGKTIY
jgi:predicted transcriptional regulator